MRDCELDWSNRQIGFAQGTAYGRPQNLADGLAPLSGQLDQCRRPLDR
jgi:hypothetical protein